MGIPTAERARVPRQCVVSRGLAGPKGRFNLPPRKGNRLIFRCHRLPEGDSVPASYLLTPRDRVSGAVAPPNC